MRNKRKDVPERHILVVEDNALIAMDLSETIREEGWGVVGPVNSVKDALSKIRSQKVDGALLDINLGGESGFLVADALTDAHLPFALVTGHSSDIVPPQFRDRPILTKPYLKHELINVMKRVVDPRPRSPVTKSKARTKK